MVPSITGGTTLVVLLVGSRDTNVLAGVLRRVAELSLPGSHSGGSGVFGSSRTVVDGDPGLALRAVVLSLAFRPGA